LKKTVPGIMLALLFISALGLAFNIPPVKTEPATIVVPDNYLTIQEAVDHANEGDTVFVRKGTYHEHVIVNKTVFLVGEDKATTVIDGNQTGTVVMVTTDNVNISGFTIQNGESGLDLNSNGNTVTSNTFSFNGAQETDLKTDLEIYPEPPVSPIWRYLYDLIDSGYTELLELTTETPILRVKVSGHDDVTQLLLGLFYDENLDGVPQLHEFAGFASRDKVTWVSLFDPPRGQYIIKVQGWDVTGNPGHFDREITRCKGYGVGAHSSSNNTVSENLFSEDYAGVYLQSCSSTTVRMNNVTMTMGGIIAGDLADSAVIGNRVFSNSFSEAATLGILLRASRNVDLTNNFLSFNDFGIHLWNSSNINVAENELLSHNGWSIGLHSSSDNSVVNNVCWNSSGLDGVRLMFSSRNNLTRNDFSHCEHSGILLWYDCSNNSIANNSIQWSGYQGWGHGHGVEVLLSYSNVFANNSILYANNQGIVAIETADNNFTRNLISSNRKGIVLRSSTGNRVYHNSIFNNSEQQGFDDTGENLWDDGYPCGGNYWSDYNGRDSLFGAYQSLTGSDGIGDTPYVVEGNNNDNYPLTSPYEYWSNPIPGDVNRDSKVSLSDVVQILDGFGAVNGSDDYYWHASHCIFCPHCPNLDIDLDDKIALNDITAVLDNFGKNIPVMLVKV
jgi:parallel beta-helix repeat protein